VNSTGCNWSHLLFSKRCECSAAGLWFVQAAKRIVVNKIKEMRITGFFL
jgi:hypothetical protein